MKTLDKTPFAKGDYFSNPRENSNFFLSKDRLLCLIDVTYPNIGSSLLSSAISYCHLFAVDVKTHSQIEIGSYEENQNYTTDAPVANDVSEMQFSPDDRQISFIHRDVLYVIPVP